MLLCLLVKKTWESKYVRYEIEYAWNNGKPIFGIYINEMKDIAGKTAPKPLFTPFELVTDLNTKQSLNDFVEIHTPIATLFQTVDKDIQNNLEDWVEDAIANPPQKRMQERGLGLSR